jgi:hypothetical protein
VRKYPPIETPGNAAPATIDAERIGLPGHGHTDTAG